MSERETLESLAQKLAYTQKTLESFKGDAERRSVRGITCGTLFVFMAIGLFLLAVFIGPVGLELLSGIALLGGLALLFLNW